MTYTWSNWGRTEQCSPLTLGYPEHTDDVVRTVAYARETGTRVRAVGASHSFSGAAVAPGVQLRLAGMQGIASLDLAHSEVTFWAGTHLWQIPGLLRPLGLALENMGDIDRQTIAGAISTGTHGTGTFLTGLSGQVAGITVVTGTGEVLTVNEREHAELLPAFALSLGALGVIVSVTLRCVPEYVLHAVEEAMPLEAVLVDFMNLTSDNDHFEFYWFPHTSIARTKRNTRVNDLARRDPLPRLQRFLDEEVANNVLLGAIVGAQRWLPGLTPTVNRAVSGVSSAREYTDLWNRVYVTQRRVRFREMEYALPRAAIPEVVRELNRAIERRRYRVSFPIEVRTAAADAVWLSTAHERESGYIAVHRYWKDRDTQYFQTAERIFTEAGGRPHWGKQHSLTQTELEVLYPRFSEFLALRNTYDPDRVFQNPYTERIFGE